VARPATEPVGLATIALEWGRMGCTGFGGPPARIALLRALCVDQRGWMSDHEFEDGVAAVNLLPGPASTQLAIFCAWRLRGPRGALIGGLCFIVPGLVMILALGQVTPGPVVLTVAAVGYAAAGVGGGLLAAVVAFAPSFVFVLTGARHFDRLRTNERARAFLTGAGAAAIGAIAGAAIPLGLALGEVWQGAVLAAAAVWLLALRKGVVVALVGAGVIGVVVALAGGPIPH
jgi:chromate transport protein ChrA